MLNDVQVLSRPSGSRQDVVFPSQSGSCAGWWYAAPGSAPAPVLVMGHGLGGTRELGLDPFARRFQAAGLAVLAFDYRHYGASSGTPRELISIPRQLEDYRAAITFARAQPGVDPSRIAIWGSSFAGGHVMTLAAEELGVVAAIAQVPFSDGLASASRIPLLPMLALTAQGLLDAVRGWLGMTPRYVPLYARPGQVALLSSADSEAGYLSLAPDDAVQAGRWRNRATARSGLSIPLYAPRRKLRAARVPVQVLVAEQDSVAPAAPTVAAAEAARVELVRLPGGHFDYYVGAGFEQIIANELRFLRLHLQA